MLTLSRPGNEALAVKGGYQVDIPFNKAQSDRNVHFLVTEKNTYYVGDADLHLGRDTNPQVIIKMHLNTQNVTVGGIVEDSRRNGLGGARVFVVGESEGMITGPGGIFSLPAHAPKGQQVQLHAEKKGYRSDQFHAAGDHGAVLVLRR